MATVELSCGCCRGSHAVPLASGRHRCPRRDRPYEVVTGEVLEFTVGADGRGGRQAVLVGHAGGVRRTWQWPASHAAGITALPGDSFALVLYMQRPVAFHNLTIGHAHRFPRPARPVWTLLWLLAVVGAAGVLIRCLG